MTAYVKTFIYDGIFLLSQDQHRTAFTTALPNAATDSHGCPYTHLCLNTYN